MLSTESLALITILGTIIGAVWGLAWWLSGQFADVRRLVYDQIEKLNHLFAEKLDYHEKHDDSRFLNVRNDIWEMRVRDAAKGGIPAVISLKKEDE